MGLNKNLKDKISVLIVEDEENFRYVLQLCLCEADFEVIAVSSAQEAFEKISTADFDFIITDLRMPQIDGFTFISQLRSQKNTSYIILMTAYGDKEKALQSLKAGADDYISKPFRPDELIIKLNIVLAKKKLLPSFSKKENAQEKNKNVGDDNIITIGASEKSKTLCQVAETAAQYKSSVLIIGETGTETESIARYIHQRSVRSDKIFAPISCGALSENLIESELFGHRKGSFTSAISDHLGIFAYADGGTIFFNEIEKLTQSIQVKLLRVLQEESIRPIGSNEEKSIDIRCISSCQSDPEILVQNNILRLDLYYRLRVITIEISPLRERLMDIPLFIQYYLRVFSQKYHRNLISIHEKALSLLQTYSWPGNVEELKSVIERAVVLSKKNELVVTDFYFLEKENSSAFMQTNLKSAVSKIEKETIENALIKTGGNKTKAAKLLGISHRALMYKLKNNE